VSIYYNCLKIVTLNHCLAGERFGVGGGVGGGVGSNFTPHVITVNTGEVCILEEKGPKLSLGRRFVFVT